MIQKERIPAERVMVIPNAYVPHLVIADEGSQNEPLREQAASLGIADRVHLTGRRADMQTALTSFDIAAVSSDYEGTPLFALECMAHATPLAATDVGGLSDLIEDGKGGILVGRQDVDALAEVLGRLLSDPARREDLYRSLLGRSV